MLKGLNKNDTTITPYIATKDWALSNVENGDLVLAEDGNTIEFEHVIYTFSEAITASTNCSIAKEDQSLDLAFYREGLKINGLFYLQTDPINLDGTYKRMVYTQIKTTFYNNYRDPTKMWGLEKIDFDASNTKKFLADYIKLLDVPPNIMGEKILENTVVIIDNNLDNPITIMDDGNNNLFAGTNLFSRQQEIGNHPNAFLSGSDSVCRSYFNI